MADNSVIAPVNNELHLFSAQAWSHLQLAMQFRASTHAGLLPQVVMADLQLSQPH
jgi:hypothetical protein